MFKSRLYLTAWATDVDQMAVEGCRVRSQSLGEWTVLFFAVDREAFISEKYVRLHRRRRNLNEQHVGTGRVWPVFSG